MTASSKIVSQTFDLQARSKMTTKLLSNSSKTEGQAALRPPLYLLEKETFGKYL
jgi:hypothetical protein